MSRHRKGSLNTHGLRIEVGKHAGVLYTQLPVGYLRYMVNVRHRFQHIARAELERRGMLAELPKIDVTGHAVDRASECALELWQLDRNPGEGLHAWLARIGLAALQGQPCGPGRYVWGPLILAFELANTWPVLKTVIYSPRAAGVPRRDHPEHPSHSEETAP